MGIILDEGMQKSKHQNQQSKNVPKLQALVYDILPSTTAITGYALCLLGIQIAVRL